MSQSDVNWEAVPGMVTGAAAAPATDALMGTMLKGMLNQQNQQNEQN